jgi:hypothetical protein
VCKTHSRNHVGALQVEIVTCRCTLFERDEARNKILFNGVHTHFLSLSSIETIGDDLDQQLRVKAEPCEHYNSYISSTVRVMRTAQVQTYVQGDTGRVAT